MKRIPLFLVVLGLIFFSACGSSEESEVERMKREVIAVHDEVMPLMGELRSFQRSLEEKADELDSRGVESPLVGEYRTAASACSAAYEGMFIWMRQFDMRMEEMNEDQSLAYLEDQAIKVAKVNEDIKTALKLAESLLAE
ncbi:hypothetical protein [Lunatimonas lonarensis]|uniref:hypothetical protein n=1 Tax=Lunatimonas lonarensis TaxID=1232681 RepID=UPI000565D9A7|nr:hypothetical protein [Lunatimonas lonarensis]